MSINNRGVVLSVLQNPGILVDTTLEEKNHAYFKAINVSSKHDGEIEKMNINDHDELKACDFLRQLNDHIKKDTTEPLQQDRLNMFASCLFGNPISGDLDFLCDDLSDAEFSSASVTCMHIPYSKIQEGKVASYVNIVNLIEQTKEKDEKENKKHLPSSLLTSLNKTANSKEEVSINALQISQDTNKKKYDIKQSSGGMVRSKVPYSFTRKFKHDHKFYVRIVSPELFDNDLTFLYYRDEQLCIGKTQLSIKNIAASQSLSMDNASVVLKWPIITRNLLHTRSVEYMYSDILSIESLNTKTIIFNNSTHAHVHILLNGFCFIMLFDIQNRNNQYILPVYKVIAGLEILVHYFTVAALHNIANHMNCDIYGSHILVYLSALSHEQKEQIKQNKFIRYLNSLQKADADRLAKRSTEIITSAFSCLQSEKTLNHIMYLFLSHELLSPTITEHIKLFIKTINEDKDTKNKFKSTLNQILKFFTKKLIFDHN